MKRFTLLLFCLASVGLCAVAQEPAHVDSARVVPNSAAVARIDTIIKENWLHALKRGKFNVADSSIHYPRAVKWGVTTFKRVNSVINDYDTTYVAGFKMKWKVFLKNNYWFDNYDCVPFKNNVFRFECSPSVSIGLYASFRGITLGYSIGVNNWKGKSRSSRKWEIGFSCARFSLDYYRISNSGPMELTIIDFANKEKLRYKNFTGIKRTSWGVSGQYYFNHKHYAPTAVYGFSRRQLISAGSFMAGFNISHQKFYLNADNLPPEFHEYAAAEQEVFTSETLYNYTDYCASVGYGYNWAIGPKWLWNGTLIVYSGLKHSHPKSISDGGSNFFSANFKARTGIIYSHNHLFGGVHGSLDTHLFNTSSQRFRRFLFDFTAVVGYRF